MDRRRPRRQARPRPAAGSPSVCPARANWRRHDAPARGSDRPREPAHAGRELWRSGTDSVPRRRSGGRPATAGGRQHHARLPAGCHALDPAAARRPPPDSMPGESPGSGSGRPSVTCTPCRRACFAPMPRHPRWRSRRTRIRSPASGDVLVRRRGLSLLGVSQLWYPARASAASPARKCRSQATVSPVRAPTDAQTAAMSRPNATRRSWNSPPREQQRQIPRHASSQVDRGRMQSFASFMIPVPLQGDRQPSGPPSDRPMQRCIHASAPTTISRVKADTTTSIAGKANCLTALARLAGAPLSRGAEPDD